MTVSRALSVRVVVTCKLPSDPAAGAIQGTKGLDHPSRRHEEEGGQDEQMMVAGQQMIVTGDGLSKAIAERVARTRMAEYLPNVRRWVVVVIVYSDESTLLLSMYQAVAAFRLL